MENQPEGQRPKCKLGVGWQRSSVSHQQVPTNGPLSFFQDLEFHLKEADSRSVLLTPRSGEAAETLPCLGEISDH
jgi:hypothetical protein